MIFGALQVTKVLSTEEAKRAIEGSGKDFGKSRSLVATPFLAFPGYRKQGPGGGVLCPILVPRASRLATQAAEKPWERGWLCPPIFYKEGLE